MNFFKTVRPSTFQNQVRQTLVEDFEQNVKAGIWASEVSAVKDGRKFRRPWSESDQKKLLSSGAVPGYDLKFQPGNSIPNLFNKNLWTFVPL